MIISQFFTYKDTTIHFLKSGNGSKALFAFHGFGQDSKVFSQFSQHNDYTVYAFDLFFHGRSEWMKNEVALEKTFWRDVMEEFLRQEKIMTISLTGYSMGAKFVFATLEAFPDKIDKVTLIAPDGIKTSFWYSLATYPLMLRSLFKSMISKPERFFALTRFAHTIRLIDKSLMRFVESQMNTEEKRNRVYLSWVVFRHLSFDMITIAEIINTHSIEVGIVVGKFDKIITEKSMDRLTSRLKNSSLEILESGHHQVLDKWITSIGKQ